jgi:hypothetical protein
MMRALLESAQVMLSRVKKWSLLKAWAMNIARRRGRSKAIVALARRLAVIMLACGVTALNSGGQGKMKHYPSDPVLQPSK